MHNERKQTETPELVQTTVCIYIFFCFYIIIVIILFTHVI